MSPLMLVLLVMFTPPDEPICLFFILDAKSLSATTIDTGAGENREKRTGQRREEAGGCDKRDDGGGNGTWGQKRKEDKERTRKGRGDEGVGWKGEKDRVQV